MADLHQLGLISAELIDRLEEDYRDAEIEVGVVALVVEVTSHKDEWTAIEFRCSDPRRWIQLGLFDAAARACSGSAESASDDGD